jgi:hypothetical protein
MRVHIDRFNSFAVDYHRKALRLWCLSTGRRQHFAAAKDDTGRAACLFEKVPSSGHAFFSLHVIYRSLRFDCRDSHQKAYC